MVLEVRQKVEEGLFGSIKVRFWLHNAYRVYWEKLFLDLWKYFLGVNVGFGSTPKGQRWVWRSSQRLKRVLNGLMKVGSWLQDAHEA